MTHFTTSKASGLIVSVPDSYEHHIFGDTRRGFCYWDSVQNCYEVVNLPFPCTFLGLSHELTEQEAQQIMPKHSERKRWVFLLGGHMMLFKTSLEAFQSLLLSLGLDPKEPFAILINDKK